VTVAISGVAKPRATSSRSAAALLRYPPLLLVLVGVVVAVLVLPSALNLPQTSPTETAEFAPVPPTDKNQAPPGGNFSSLGLSSSDTVGGDNGPGGGALQNQDQGPPTQATGGTGGNTGGTGVPPNLRCVGKPPRQSEDPLSPPCISAYVGNNGGATYPGVTANEVKVIVYMDGGTCVQFGQETSSGVTRPYDTYFDFDKPPDTSSSDPGQQKEATSQFAEGIRALDVFFNNHYQFYHRHIHMFLWHGRQPSGSAVCETGSDREADAAEQIQTVHPFAVLNLAGTNADSYTNYMNAKGVVTFTSESRLTNNPAVGVPASGFQKYPGLVWSYLPSMETNATWFANFVCAKFNGLPPSVTSDPTLQNKATRKFGFVYAYDPDLRPFKYFADAVRRNLSQTCGINIPDQDTEVIPVAGYNIDERQSAKRGYTNQYAQTAMAQFKTDGVTTIIWAGGDDDYTTKAAQSYAYSPEWVFFGDRQMDSTVGGFYQVQSQWQNAWTMSNVELYPGEFQQECYLAYQESDPNATAPGQWTSYVACQEYPDIRLIATGIQVAGPHLTPQSMDQGFHAIPKVALNSPYAPTCYFNPGDYSCIKDAEYSWWDSTKTGPDPGANPGCYRMIQGGKRWLEGKWDQGQIDALRDKNNDPCNDYT
jgi:hypothetical protein